MSMSKAETVEEWLAFYAEINPGKEWVKERIEGPPANYLIPATLANPKALEARNAALRVLWAKLRLEVE